MSAELDQLDAQQQLLTDSLARMLQGQWTGFPSLQADIEALSPGIELEPHPPVLESEAGPAPPPSYLANYDPDTYMPPQSASWTCSACALSWLLRATQVDPGMDEWSAVGLIGQPQNINPTYGLMDGSGAQLQRVLRDYGVPSEQGWLTYDTAWATYSQVPGMMSGGAWYHWVGVRGTVNGNLWVANSAPGYKSVWDVVTREDFARLGPFSCIWIMA